MTDRASLIRPAGSVDTPETRHWRARYAAAVTKVDDDLGQFTTPLEHLGAEHTISV